MLKSNALDKTSQTASPVIQAAMPPVVQAVGLPEPDKINDLVTLVGELVIASAAIGAIANQQGNSTLAEAYSLTARLIEQVRDLAMKMRTVAIGDTFHGFQQSVDALALQLGKSVALEISGGDTELDKSMVDKLAPPLLQLISNSIVHGIELPQVRTAQGKPANGTLRLSAHQESSNVVIELSDDGAGLDHQRLLQRAISAGLVSSGQAPTYDEITQLVFMQGLPGSPGLDQARQDIHLLRGVMDVQSAPQQGTTIQIRLPLTLAIIDGFLVSVANQSFVVPLDTVIECVDAGVKEGCMNLRDEALPIISLRNYFGCQQPSPARENVVVVHCGSKKAGLLVDRLHGEVQTVIKPLASLFSSASGISGSTIQGNGEVALVLDVPALIRQVEIVQASMNVNPEQLALVG